MAPTHYSYRFSAQDQLISNHQNLPFQNSEKTSSLQLKPVIINLPTASSASITLRLKASSLIETSDQPEAQIPPRFILTHNHRDSIIFISCPIPHSTDNSTENSPPQVSEQSEYEDIFSNAARIYKTSLEVNNFFKTHKNSTTNSVLYVEKVIQPSSSSILTTADPLQPLQDATQLSQDKNTLLQYPQKYIDSNEFSALESEVTTFFGKEPKETIYIENQSTIIFFLFDQIPPVLKNFSTDIWISRRSLPTSADSTQQTGRTQKTDAYFILGKQSLSSFTANNQLHFEKHKKPSIQYGGSHSASDLSSPSPRVYLQSKSLSSSSSVQISPSVRPSIQIETSSYRFPFQSNNNNNTNNLNHFHHQTNAYSTIINNRDLSDTSSQPSPKIFQSLPLLSKQPQTGRSQDDLSDIDTSDISSIPALQLKNPSFLTPTRSADTLEPAFATTQPILLKSSYSNPQTHSSFDDHNSQNGNKKQVIQRPGWSSSTGNLQPACHTIEEEDDFAAFRDQFARRPLAIDFPSDNQKKKQLDFIPSQTEINERISKPLFGPQISEKLSIPQAPKDSSDLMQFESEEFRKSKLQQPRSKKEGSINTGQESIKHIILSDDSAYFISTSHVGIVAVWHISTQNSTRFDLRNGQSTSGSTQSTQPPPSSSAATIQIHFLKSLGDNDRFIVGTSNKTVVVFSLVKMEIVHTISVKRKEVFTAAVLPDMNLIALAGLNLSKLASIGKSTKRRNIKFYNLRDYKYEKKLDIPSSEDIITHMVYCVLAENQTQNPCKDSILSASFQSFVSSSSPTKGIISRNNKNILAFLLEGSYGSRLSFIEIDSKKKRMTITLSCEMLTLGIYKAERLLYSQERQKLICMAKPNEKKGQEILSFLEIDIFSKDRLLATKHTPSFKQPILDIQLLTDNSTLIVIPADKYFYLYDLNDKAIIDRSNSLQSNPTLVYVSPQNIAALHLNATSGKINLFKLPS